PPINTAQQYNVPYILMASLAVYPILMAILMAFLLVTFVITISLSTADLTMYPLTLQQLNWTGELSLHATDIETASLDFGGISHVKPLAVLHPGSVEDLVSLVKAAYDAAESSQAFTVSARGNGHSLNGQAQTGNGIVVDMSRFRVSEPVLGALNNKGEEKVKFVDVWGGDLWIDVLKWSLKYGLAPKSWTDYLYLTVGGTLSNAGVSGQAYIHGPQISNAYELDVVTGKGELLTCSEEKNAELFHGVLGGLGQFGIITRARIALKQAPQMVRWIRVLYSNFSTFTGDQEYLISLHGKPSGEKFDYVEGFVIVDAGLVNTWRTSYIFPRDLNISSLATDDGLLYCLEITKNYDESTADMVDQEIEPLLKKLNFIPSSVLTNDVSYLDFLDRVHKEESKLRNQNLWDVLHPWLILNVPKSRIADFANGVFKGFLGNKTVGPIIIYPLNKDK
ncbi:hypothetical protein IFM89_026098, partial [Coptis chinensis]